MGLKMAYDLSTYGATALNTTTSVQSESRVQICPLFYSFGKTVSFVNAKKKTTKAILICFETD